LGISLQATGREAEAKTAYQRALTLGTLTPEMQRFAEQRLNGGQKRQGE
jgi:predicted RNA polymerase sigma factor